MQAEQLLGVHDLFYRATLGAADVLHLANRIGNLVQGKQADFIIVDLAVKQAVPDPNLPLGTALAQLAYTGDDRVVVKTFVSGYEVYASS
jgi:guanine deaminase